jgi:hypothetical protein
MRQMQTPPFSRLTHSLSPEEMKGSLHKFPEDSSPMESDNQSRVAIQRNSTIIDRFVIGKESSVYQELREIRLPSAHAIKRNVKKSINKLRCRGLFKADIHGITTYDDYTANLYGCCVDDELPLLDDSFAQTEESQ